MSDERNELPQGWVWAKLAEVASGIKGKKPKSQGQEPSPESVPYVTIETFESGKPKVFTDDLSGPQCGPEDVLLVWDGARAGLCGRGVSGIVGSTIVALRTKGINPGYLFRFIQSRYDGFNSRTRGTGTPHLDPTIVWTTAIPLPPLAEQRRIATKIEALFEQTRTARKALDRIPPLLKKFRQSVLAAAFRGDLTRDWREQNPDVEPASALLEHIRAKLLHEWEGRHRGPKPAERKTDDMGDLPELPPKWVRCTLEQCTTLITKGESPNWQGYQYVADGVPFVRSENVLWGVLDLSEVARIPDTFHQKLQRSRLKPDDVLINLVGASIGRCAIVPSELSEANINQAVATIRTTDALYPPYLLRLLLSPPMQKIIQSKRVEVARPNISLGDLNNLIIPIAPIAEQEHIASRVEDLFAQAAAIEGAVEAARRRADKLEQSILTRAFHGELVPQDPNDEPASVLLKRIGTERGMARG